MTEPLNALQRAYVIGEQAAVRQGEPPDGWIIGGQALAELRACRASMVAMVPATEAEPEKLFGLPVTVHGREGVYPTFDAKLARSSHSSS